MFGVFISGGDEGGGAFDDVSKVAVPDDFAVVGADF